MTDALKHYYFVGGRPEAVQSFAENEDFNEVREIQKRILAKTYQEKFSPEVSVRTSMADYKKEDWLVNLRLYAVDQITQI